jgi:hypothetical protein
MLEPFPVPITLSEVMKKGKGSLQVGSASPHVHRILLMTLSRLFQNNIQLVFGLADNTCALAPHIKQLRANLLLLERSKIATDLTQHAIVAEGIPRHYLVAGLLLFLEAADTLLFDHIESESQHTLRHALHVLVVLPLSSSESSVF